MTTIEKKVDWQRFDRTPKGWKHRVTWEPCTPEEAAALEAAYVEEKKEVDARCAAMRATLVNALSEEEARRGAPIMAWTTPETNDDAIGFNFSIEPSDATHETRANTLG